MLMWSDVAPIEVGADETLRNIIGECVPGSRADLHATKICNLIGS